MLKPRQHVGPAKRQRRSAGVRHKMRLIDPYTGFREGCEIALETGSLLNLDVGNFAGPFRLLRASFTLIFPPMSLVIFPPISLINLFAETRISTCDWGNLADFGEQEVYGH